MKVVFILLLDVVLVLGQAPGDSQDICRTDFRYRVQHDWIPYVNDTAVGVRGEVKWQVLLDQYDYQNILGQATIPPGVWMQRDIDGDGVQLFQSGTTCTNTLQLRNTFRNPNSNNWVFTQAVSYLDAIEVIVNATVRFRGCQDRSSLNPPCQNNFVTLHRYDTNSERTTNEITNVTNFQPCFGDRASSRLEQTGSAITNVIKTFDRPDFAMTYFGIQDNGTYGDVRRILVYYRVAQGYEQGLVRCPNIPLPKEDSGESVSKNCTCKDNAMPVNSLTRTCHGNGVCEGNPMCVCQPGYQYDETQKVCQACDAGQYGRGGNTSCVACPANSTSTRASGYCPCIEGHYRPDSDNIGIKCTAPPPPMTECTSNTVYDTGAVLQWRNPPHCGGRTDCYYQISINNGPAVRYDPTNFNFNALETYTVNNLQPDTTYSITVSIHNGVSDQDADNAKVRECQIVVMTIPGSVFMLGGTTYLNNTAAIIEHIGVGEVNSLKCTTALETCCRSSGQGDFYYPNGAQVMIESGGENFYRTRSSRSISLNRRGGNTPLGEYRCEIPDGRGNLQKLYITFGTNTECPVVCPTCPSFPTTSPPPTCGTPTTCTPSPGNVLNPIVFELGGTTYPNNTIVLLEDIGVGDSALLCVSNNTGCCTSTSGFKGEFYYPNGSVVPIQSMQHSFYRNRGSGFIRLNQQLNAVTPPPLGRYRCDIQDDEGVTQSVFINIVQNTSCPTDICTPSPPVSTCPTPSVVNCDDCPTATAQTCPPPTTCPTSDGISFQFGGQTYPNNSVFLMTDIGADDMALMCVTDHTPCCQTTQEGEWFYPDNTPVSTSGAGMNFYRDRGSQTVRLNRRNSALSPTGRYRCTIPDATGTMQTLVANIIDTSCPQLNDPEHYQVTITPTSISLVLPNSTAMYTCNTGYQLSETSGRRCQNNGTWTGEAVTCPELVNPENGKVTQNGEEAISSTTVGSEVTYSCNAGYELVGDSSRTCGSSGHWSGDAPECMLLPSPSTTPPTMTPPSTTTPDSSTTTSAPLGNTLQFELKGSVYSNGSTISMEDIGEDVNALFCRTDRTDCCTGANRLGEFYYPNGSRVGVKKDNGPMYRNRGDQAVLLNRNTDSLNAPPTGWYRCEIPNSNGVTKSISINVAGTGCPQLNDPEHGHVTITPTSSSLVLPNSTATYTCNTGYQLNETSGRRCQNNGTWTGNKPTCEAVTCPELVNPENGKVTQNGEEAISSTTVGSEVTYSCNAGYELVGDSSRTCGSSGHWSGDAPECMLVSTPTTGNTLQFELKGSVYSNGSTISMEDIGEDVNALFCRTNRPDCCTGANRLGEFYYPSGSRVGVKNDNGPMYRNRGDQAVLLNRNTNSLNAPPTGWYRCEIPNSNGVTKSISINVAGTSCPQLNDPEHGQVTITPTSSSLVLPNSTAMYTCNTGYQLSETSGRRCQNNGTWTGNEPTCEAVTCPELANPENGKVTQNGEEAISSTTVGSEVTYSCNDGYELVGDSSRTCGSSGHWSGDVPECIVTDCPQLINPDNGQVTPFGYSPGSIALYKCNKGFEIESGHSATRTCGLDHDGQWSGVPPTCVQSVQCPLLEHPDGGLVTVGGDRTPGSVATYSCDGGYSLLGSTTRECLTNGTWSNKVPTCSQIHCPLLDHPDSGLVTVGGERTPGSVATYSCNGGYSLLGSTTRECLTNGTWSNKVPTCSQIGFQLNDNFYSNGSSILMSSIGEGDAALQCITDGECCTPPNRAGEFLYPDGTTVKIGGSGDNLYRNRGVGMIRLNRRNEASSPTGTYTCQIPDSSGELQNIFITLN